MKIEEFNNEIKCGDSVFYGGKKLEVRDIDRNRHTAFLSNYRWIRCSEFSKNQPDKKEEAVEKGEKKARRIKRGYRVKAIFSDGTEDFFDSMIDASRHLGIDVGSIKYSLRHPERKFSRTGVTFKYLDMLKCSDCKHFIYNSEDKRKSGFCKKFNVETSYHTAFCDVGVMLTPRERRKRDEKEENEKKGSN